MPGQKALPSVDLNLKKKQKNTKKQVEAMVMFCSFFFSPKSSFQFGLLANCSLLCSLSEIEMEN